MANLVKLDWNGNVIINNIQSLRSTLHQRWLSWLRFCQKFPYRDSLHTEQPDVPFCDTVCWTLPARRSISLMRILIFFLLELYLFRNHALLTVFFDLGKNTLTLGWKFRAKLTHSFLDFNMVFIIFTLKRLTLSIWAENKKSFIVLSLTSTKRKTSSMYLESKS